MAAVSADALVQGDALALETPVVPDATIPLLESGIPVTPDPLHLRKFIVAEEDLMPLRKKRKTRRVYDFYQHQNDTIMSFLTPPTAKDRLEGQKDHRIVQIVIWGALAVTVVLVVIQLIAAIQSGAMSIYALMVDVMMDLLSGIILAITDRLGSAEYSHKYPAVSVFWVLFHLIRI